VEWGCSGGTAALPLALPFALTFARPAPAPRSLPPAAAAARYDDAAQCHVLLGPDCGELIPLVTYLRRQRHPHDQYGT